MNTFKKWQGLALALSLAWSLSACATMETCDTPTCKADQAITKAVKAKLNTEPSLMVDTLQVRTENGVVYLSGVVSTRVETDLAGRLAQVPGVKQIRNNIVTER